MNVEEALLARKKELELSQPKAEEVTIEETTPKEEVADNVEEVVSEVAESAIGDEEVNQKQEAYEPNYTYSVKGESREFDDWVKPLINKENEDKFRDYFTKVGGFESYKQKVGEYEETIKKYEEDFTAYATDAQNLAKVVIDFNQGIKSESIEDKFKTLKGIGLDEDQILKIAQYAITLKELPPDQRRLIDERNQFLEQKSAYESKYLESENRYKELLVSQHRASISNAVQNYKDIASLYDTQKGNGKFVQDVERFGLWNAQNGNDMTYDQAVSEFIRFNGLQSQTSQQQAPTNINQVPVKKVVAPLPNLSGSGTSPIKKSISSLDDLKALADKHI